MFSASSAMELVALLTWFGSLEISGLPRSIYTRPSTLSLQALTSFRKNQGKRKSEPDFDPLSNESHFVGLDTTASLMHSMNNAPYRVVFDGWYGYAKG